MKKEMEGRNWIQVNIYLYAFAATDRNRRCAICIGDVGIVCDRIGHIQRAIDRSAGRAFPLRPRTGQLRIGMNRVPGTRGR
jgi:hypothetical protein